MTNKKDSSSKKVIATIRLLVNNFFEHEVGKNAAALAYYLVFAIFPLLILLSNVLGLLNLNVAAITNALQRFLPTDIVVLIESYFEHISHTSSTTLLWFSLIFTIWFPMRAVKGLMDDVRLAYGLDKPEYPIFYILKQLIYTLLLLFVIVFTLLLSTLGKHFIAYIISYLPENTTFISNYLLNIWQYVRFVPIGFFMFAALGTLYAASLDTRPSSHDMKPGIIAALISWLLVSIAFSFYVENFANYSIIYGTLGAVIVLLMWLYMTAVILIMGAELNSVLSDIHRQT